MRTIAYAWLSPLDPTPLNEQPWPQAVDQLVVDRCPFDQPRAELTALLQANQTAGPIQLWVHEIGELGPTPQAVFAVITALEAQGSQVITVDESYVSRPEAAIAHPTTLLNLASVVERQHRNQRLRAGHARNRLQLLPPPGRAPYGYRRGRYRYALDKATAPVAKAFFENFILYGSIRGAARHIEKTYGKKIAPATAQRWLQNPAYRGDCQYKDGRIIRDTHTPIIDREEAAQVDRLLRRNRKLPPKTVSAARSLAGLVQCADCQSRLKVSRVTRPRQSQEYLYLRPQQCPLERPCRALDYDSVLQQTIQSICQTFPQAVERFSAPPVKIIKRHLQTEIQHKESILTKIPELKEQGVLDDPSAAMRIYNLKNEIATLQQKISQLPPDNLPEIAKTIATEDFWRGLSESERRVYLREFIQSIQINRIGETWSVNIQFVV
ncbi:MAG: recombinase family protein [Leptolyngbyaceae cyanobacterium]